MRSTLSSASLWASALIVPMASAGGHSGPSWGPPGGGPWGPPGGGWGPPGGGSGSGSGGSCSTITADQIRKMGNNTLFTRWRPQSHVIAPAGWQNDPCGSMYDPTRDLYYIGYQWHPEHINWGNISWGQATSKDMITWTDHVGWEGTDALILGPSGNGSYNGLGIFSGTQQPVNLKGEVDGTLLIMYTSVSKLPTGWSIPYQPHTESQSLAYSTDGGLTYQEYEGNPVIDATTETAPMYWNITGFRDPFLEPSPELDALLQVSEPHYYAVFGSGIKGVGPRMPLWTAPASDLTKWSFLGALWEPTDNSTLGPVLSTGSYGFNFEVSGFFSLYDSAGKPHWFVNMGSEGGQNSFHQSAHWALWNEGIVTRRDNGSAEFTPIAGGAADWGLGYALSSFNDTKNNRRVQWAWTPEDIVGDNGIFSANQQGFQGSLSLPRELFVHEVHNVVATSALTSAKEAVVTTSDCDNTSTVTAQTLGVRPLPEVVIGLRAKSHYSAYSTLTAFNSTSLLSTCGSASLEIKATIKTSSISGNVGLIIAASPDLSEHTSIIFSPSNNTILVNRDASSFIKEFNNDTVTAYFAPYILSATGSPEDIEMNVFVDGSLVEIYINDRFALSTRVYPANDCSTGYGVWVGDGASAMFESFEVWEGLTNAWPERPANSSSVLKWDTDAETNNRTWWTGN